MEKNRRIIRWLQVLSVRCTSKAHYLVLLNYIKAKETHFRRVYYWDRGSGKTFALIKLAQKFKCPILAPTSQSRDYIKSIAHYKKIKGLQVDVVNEFIRDKRYDLVLCDEGISQDLLDNIIIPNAKCVVGYCAVGYL